MLGTTTSKILQMLLGNEYISGEDIASTLGLSRAAVWKHIETLRTLGYIISSQSGQGYSIVSSPDIPLPEEVTRHLPHSSIDWIVTYLPQCTSSNLVLKDLAGKGATEGHVIVTDHQTAGRGRRGRQWLSDPKSALLFSVLLRPKLPPDELLPLTVVIGVVMAEVLRNLGVNCELKWPNDILVDEAKVCGILAEISGEPDHTDYVIIGIGLNVRGSRTLDDYGATALDAHITPPHRGELLASILLSIEKHYRQFTRKDIDNILRRWEDLSATVGRRVVIHSATGDIEGTAIGLSPSGGLYVTTSDGKLEIKSGEVSLRHTPPNQH